MHILCQWGAGGGTNTPAMVYGLLRMTNPPPGALDAVRDAHPRRHPPPALLYRYRSFENPEFFSPAAH